TRQKESLRPPDVWTSNAIRPLVDSRGCELGSGCRPARRTNARMAGFLCRLCGPDGSDFGDYAAAVPDMQAGDVLYADGWPKWRVRAVVSTDGLRGDVLVRGRCNSSSASVGLRRPAARS